MGTIVLNLLSFDFVVLCVMLNFGIYHNYTYIDVPVISWELVNAYKNAPLL